MFRNEPSVLMSSYVNQIQTQIIKATMEVSLWLLLYTMSFLRYITTGHEQYGEGFRTGECLDNNFVNYFALTIIPSASTTWESN